MKAFLAASLVLLTIPSDAGPPAKVDPVRKASTDLSVAIVVPDNRYDVTIRPKEAPAAGVVVVWTISPRTGTTTVSRSRSEWHLKAPPGHYEVVYMTIAGEEQLDSYYEFDVGPPKPPTPPTPPTPADPLQASVNSAFLLDNPLDPSQKFAMGNKYVAYYVASASVCASSTATNTDQLWTQLQAVENTSGVDPSALVGCRSILKAQMKALYPNGSSVNVPLDAATRQATANLYSRFAALLQGAMK